MTPPQSPALKRYLVRRLEIEGRPAVSNRLVTVEPATGRIVANEPFAVETHTTTYAAAMRADSRLSLISII